MISQQDIKNILISLISEVDVTLTVNKNTVEIEGLGDGVNILVTAPVSIVTMKMSVPVGPTKDQPAILNGLKSPSDMTICTNGCDIERAHKASMGEKATIIRRLMDVEGLNQTEVAKRLGYTQSHISNILKKFPPVKLKVVTNVS